MICMREGCNKEIKLTGVKYCSLSCSSKDSKDKKPKKFHRKNCVNCGKSFLHIDKRIKFCGSSCSATYNNKIRQRVEKIECNWCMSLNKEKNFCNWTCKNKWLTYEWLAGRRTGSTKYGTTSYVKKYILSRSGGRCEGIDSRTKSRCIEDRVVELDHINGDPYDNRVENLRHLCPTCHALTSTYGKRNLGNGRAWKSEYSQYVLKELRRNEDKI